MPRLFTCARPGYGKIGKGRNPVDEGTINLWINGLPKAEALHIISLLGHKRDGFSEFGYYPFRSSEEPGVKPTFQEWLDTRFGLRFLIHEFRTEDHEGIPPEVLNAAKSCVLGLIEQGKTIAIVDSAGAERGARVCEAIGCNKPTRAK